MVLRTSNSILGENDIVVVCVLNFFQASIHHKPYVTLSPSLKMSIIASSTEEAMEK
jgi:hypothetical protein